MVTVYQLIKMAMDNALHTGQEEEFLTFKAMLDNLTIGEAGDPAAYFGVM